MKIKELKRSVNVSWSPAEHAPVLLAAGSAAQQVDASFSSTSQLDLYSLNLEDPGLDLELKASVQTQHKFHKLVWSGAGIIVGGCDGGLLEFYSADKLLKNDDNPLIGSNTKHNNQVSALDINPYQKNLLASGASDSEIFIWDLNNTSQPMAPGNKSQPLDPVQAVAWNQQVQHILGSTFSSRCVVWDLRKNEPIMKLSDSQSRTRWRALAWHPGVATQLCVASEDDQLPVLQLWDLRLAASPLVSLEGHGKGALALSWCRQDPALLLSAGKDGAVLCWNPNNTQPGGELLMEVAHHQQWVYDVSWCGRDPSLLASSAGDQLVAVHSLLGGGGSARPESSGQSQSNILEAFGAASLGALPSVSRAPRPEPARAHLPYAPRWLRRPAAAKFAFGGKLVTFENCPQEESTQKTVYISQVVHEPELLELAPRLEALLAACLSHEPAAADQLQEYCRQKGEAAADQHERYTWFFLRANFLPTFRSEVLDLLGFKQEEIPPKFKGGADAAEHAGLSRGESTETEAELSTDTSTDLSDAQTLIERKLANMDLEPTAQNVVIPSGEDSTSLICRALVCGNLEEAVELCLDAKRVADALIIASLGSQELLYKVQRFHVARSGREPVALLAAGLLASRWDSLVQSASPSSWRHVLAAIVTHTEPDQTQLYCEMLGDKLAQESEPGLSEAATLCYLCAASAEPLVARGRGRGPRSAQALLRHAELALLARRAAVARGRQVQSGGALGGVLAEVAARLAGAGALPTALRCLEGVDTELKDRLATALGLNARRTSQPQPAPTFARVRTGSAAHAHKRHVVGHNDVSNTYSAVAPSYNPNPWATPAPVAAPAQPPRPGSVGPHAGGITASKSKYKVDPSVQSAPLYNQYSFNNAQPPAYGFNSPLPEQYSGATVPGYQPNQYNQPNQNTQPNQYTQPNQNTQPNQYTQPNQNTNPNPINPTLNPANSGVNPLNPNVNPLNPSMNPLNPSMNPLNPNAVPLNPSVNPLPANSGPAVNHNGGYSAAPGWNDPPPVTSKPKCGGQGQAGEMCARHAGTRRWARAMLRRRAGQPKQEVQQQAPITHPLFGVEPVHVPLNPAQYPGQQYPGQQLPGQQQYPGQPGQQQYPGQQYPGQQQYEQYQQQYVPPVQPYPQQSASPLPPVEAAPAQKAALPEEHRLLQTVLDGIRQECADRAANPQMKRKLEDVQRRLETLYDMLREYRLSESALATLQECAGLAAGGRHGAALRAAAALAAGADFAAAAAFLPGLKTLFSLAHQLQVHSS